MSSKTALDRELRSLRDLLDRERKAHADILKAKNDALSVARALNPMAELGRSYPALFKRGTPDNPQPGLIELLLMAHESAMVLRSATGDGRGNGTPTPYESGASTRGDRSRLITIDERLEKTAEWVSDLLGDRGPVAERPPQCGNPQCPAHAWAQPYDAEVCGSCGMPFGKYYPKLSSTRRRCKTNSCPHHDRVGECEHSLLGASRSTST